MSAVTQIFEALDAISRRIWDVSLDDSASDTIRQKASMLSMQVAVHQALGSTARQLSQPQDSTGLLNAQSRVGKFMDAVYGKPDSDKNEARWQKLRDMDCVTFLFIGVSYTPLDIIKMHRTEFDYLASNVKKFQQVKALPPKWIFRKEIQVAVAGKADLVGATDFRRSTYVSSLAQGIYLMWLEYYALEFNSDSVADEQIMNQSRPGARDLSRSKQC